MVSISPFPALIWIVETARFSSQTRSFGSSRPAISYTVQAGHAMTVQARESGVLRIRQGRFWLTFSHAGSNRCAPAGDYFLECGESLQLAAGQTVVIEPCARAAPDSPDSPEEQGAATPASVRWEADAPPRPSAGLQRVLDWMVA